MGSTKSYIRNGAMMSEKWNARVVVIGGKVEVEVAPRGTWVRCAEPLSRWIILDEAYALLTVIQRGRIPMLNEIVFEFGDIQLRRQYVRLPQGNLQHEIFIRNRLLPSQNSSASGAERALKTAIKAALMGGFYPQRWEVVLSLPPRRSEVSVQ